MIRLLMICAASVFFLSCFGDNDIEEIEKIVFEIDETKLSKPYADDSLQITFRVPKDLKPLSQKHKLELWTKIDSMNLVERNILIAPKHIFVDSSLSFLLMIHTISAIPESSNSNNLESIYSSYLNRQLDKNTLKKGKFIKDDIMMTQYVIKDGSKMLFKLFFCLDVQRLIQFDYFIFSNYEQNIKAIESSIGSIQKSIKGGE